MQADLLPVRHSPSGFARPNTTKRRTRPRSPGTWERITPNWSSRRRRRGRFPAPATADHVRRAIRRPIADPDLPGIAIGATARDGQSLGRRWRQSSLVGITGISGAQHLAPDRLGAAARELSTPSPCYRRPIGIVEFARLQPAVAIGIAAAAAGDKLHKLAGSCARTAPKGSTGPGLTMERDRGRNRRARAADRADRSFALGCAP